ncbi:hypothetical protein PHYSODRAFT_512138, partial [Phytophthora sojae]
GPATDLDEKPQPPPQVPSGTPAGHDANRDLPDESPPAQAGTQPPSARSTKKKPARSKSSRKKMKAPDSDADDRADLTLTVAEDQLVVTYYKKELHAFLLQDDVMKLLRPKLLGDLAGPVSQPTPGSDKLDAVQTLLRLFKEVGIIAGVLDAESLFDLKLSTIQNSAQRLFLLLKPLVGESSRSLKETSRSPQTLSRSAPPDRRLRPTRVAKLGFADPRIDHVSAASTAIRSLSTLHSLVQTRLAHPLGGTHGEIPSHSKIRARHGARTTV